jgi:hypothetical protein
MRRTCGKFAWNTDNGWLWRHKTSAFARRFGITDLGQMKMYFGPRWACHLQNQILVESLAGAVFPSRAAAEQEMILGWKLAVAQDKAGRLIERNPAAKTDLLTARKYDDSPVWAVLEWFGEKAEFVPPSLEAVRQAEENAAEMRLCAMRMPAMRELAKPGRPAFKSWLDYTAEENW